MLGSFLADLEHTETDVDAAVVFVGFGVTAPEQNYDDYAGVNVRGKIVAVPGNAPARFSSTQRAYYTDGIVKAKDAVAHGAVGMLGLLPEDENISPWEWSIPQIQAGVREWLDHGSPYNSFPELEAEAVLSVRGAQLLFSDAPRTLEDVFTKARNSQPQAFPLRWTAKMHTVASHQALSSRNVIGKIQGPGAQWSVRDSQRTSRSLGNVPGG